MTRFIDTAPFTFEQSTIHTALLIILYFSSIVSYQNTQMLC